MLENETIEDESTESGAWEKFFVKFYRDNLKARKLIINQEIEDEVIIKHTMQLIEMDKAPGPITIYINSDGGSLYESINLVDVILSLKNKVTTVCMSRAFSGAFCIYLAGSQRIIYPHSILMMHPIKAWFGDENTPSILKEAEFLKTMTKRLAKYFSERTERKERYWENKVLKSAHDVYFFAEEAIKAGIATQIFNKGDNG